MKALAVDRPPTGPWHCEIKFDGFRSIALLEGKNVTLWSRNQKPMSNDYPDIVAALAKLNRRGDVLDGEIVALDAKGRSHFQLLQGRDLPGTKAPLAYYVFDILTEAGESLLERKWEERRKRLEKLLRKAANPVQLSPVFDVAPGKLLEVARQKGLEGIIAKRPGSVYEAGRRSGAWVKCKVSAEQEFVIGGFTLPQRSRTNFGAILVGYHDGGQLRYAGKVGSGFSHATLATLHRVFLRRSRKTCPFANLPMERRPRFGQGMTRAEMRKVTWIRPELVAQIRFVEWTQDGLLRQPVFLGLRDDKPANEVRREAGPVAG
jgi:bifunctional non-homologous end joining protein LigD